MGPTPRVDGSAAERSPVSFHGTDPRLPRDSDGRGWRLDVRRSRAPYGAVRTQPTSSLKGPHVAAAGGRGRIAVQGHGARPGLRPAGLSIPHRADGSVARTGRAGG